MAAEGVAGGKLPDGGGKKTKGGQTLLTVRIHQAAVVAPQKEIAAAKAGIVAPRFAI